MRIGIVLVAAVFMGVSFQTTAADTIRVDGVGGDSCGALVQAYREGSPSIGVQSKGRIFSAQSQLYAQWLSGFYSAYNGFVAKTGDFSGGVDMQGLSEWVRSYCEKNPTHLVFRAASESTSAISPKK